MPFFDMPVTCFMSDEWVGSSKSNAVHLTDVCWLAVFANVSHDMDMILLLLFVSRKKSDNVLYSFDTKSLENLCWFFCLFT